MGICGDEMTYNAAVTAHNHDPSDTKVAAVRCRSQIKQQTKQSFDKPSHIMTQAMSQIDVSAMVELGREESTKHTLCNQRLGRISPLPESHQYLVIERGWSLTTGPDPQQFLVYDNGPKNAQETYDNLLHAIVDKCWKQDPDPNTVVIYSEITMVRAAASMLGDDVAVQGCFYHRVQSTWQKVQDLGLIQRFKDSVEDKLLCGMMDSLSLLPIDYLPAGLEFLRNNTPKGIEPLLNYVNAIYCTDTYRRIQRHAPGGEGQDAIMLHCITSFFQPHIWNVHQVNLDGEQHTNIFCDAWNHRIEHLCGVSHPSVWQLIHWLKTDAAQVSTTLLNAACRELPRLHQICWTDEMGARLLKSSFKELVTTSTGNLMVELCYVLIGVMYIVFLNVIIM
ncbi:hypothetical protein LSH36_606g02026 [Paralvinella palmiformis]|uniref:MULE transposase domain-containing protein n=1 Tax=Paralvinella palmiformis TaxID=53620 RepID=A0AAD9J4F6_9ANNE|nr:hypothetical protein LSH36_606g02026 [Paralvinella palmiformis]